MYGGQGYVSPGDAIQRSRHPAGRKPRRNKFWGEEELWLVRLRHHPPPIHTDGSLLWGELNWEGKSDISDSTVPNPKPWMGGKWHRITFVQATCPG